MASLRKRGRVWYYRFVDADGISRERKGCPDRRETEAMAAGCEAEASKVKAGLIDPKALAYRAHEARPLAEHLDDFQAAGSAKGSTAKHVKLFTDRARRVVALVKGARLETIDAPRRSTAKQRADAAEATRGYLKAARLSDLTPSGIQRALSTLVASGRALATVNHHRAAIKAFAAWAKDDGRMRDDPTGSVTGYNAREDRRHDRRTISLEELRRLIDEAQRGPTYRLMTGPARALCYRLAVSTGLRYSEIKSVTPASLDLSNPAPTVSVSACYTKNGEPATLPLPDDVASDLARYVVLMASDAPVFPLPDSGPKMLKIDLAAAGIAYRDASGLVFDFHALRCQCATLADAAGVSPRVTQALMRHSTLELTGRYTRPRTLDIDRASGMLPSLRSDPQKPDSLAATGTDGQHIKNLVAHPLPIGGDGMSRKLTDADVMAGKDARSSMERNPLLASGFDASGRELSEVVATSGVRTRTGDLRIMRPPL